MCEIPLSESARIHFDYLTLHGVRLLDQRDPEGSERLHCGDAERALGFEGVKDRHGWSALTTPCSVSGGSTRNPEGAASILESTLREASRMMAEWERAARLDRIGSNPNTGRGGSVVQYPIAVCLSNYGASVLCDSRRSIVLYFKS